MVEELVEDYLLKTSKTKRDRQVRTGAEGQGLKTSKTKS